MHLFLKIYLILSTLIPLGGTVEEENEKSNLNQFRNNMLEEINFLRAHPAEYAEKRFGTLKEEGADNGAYEYLKRVKPASTLKFNEILNEIATDYALFMAKKDKFSHTANGTPFSRAKKAGYTYTAMGENIACGNDPKLNAYKNPQYAAIEFVKMLVLDKGVKDLGHRHTLMNPVFKSVGFGFGHNEESYCINYVVQDFGNP